MPAYQSMQGIASFGQLYVPDSKRGRILCAVRVAAGADSQPATSMVGADSDRSACLKVVGLDPALERC
jgi:hypothetical protein